MSRFHRSPISSLLVSLLLCLMIAGCAPRRQEQAEKSTQNQAAPTAQGRFQPQDARILTNQVGYEPLGAKKAVIQGERGRDVRVVHGPRAGRTARWSSPGRLVTTARSSNGKTGTSGRSIGARSRPRAPISSRSPAARAVAAPILSSRSPASSRSSAASPPLLRSHPVLVQRNALERGTLSDVIYYFKGQRSSGLWDKADRAMTFDGRAGTVDVRGGWFDATGDYGKHLSHLSFSTYFNPQQVSLTAWSLFMALRELERRNEPAFIQYRKRLLDEALFGADYLVRSKDPNGSFYITVSGRGPGRSPRTGASRPRPSATSS